MWVSNQSRPLLRVIDIHIKEVRAVVTQPLDGKHSSRIRDDHLNENSFISISPVPHLDKLKIKRTRSSVLASSLCRKRAVRSGIERRK